MGVNNKRACCLSSIVCGRIGRPDPPVGMAFESEFEWRRNQLVICDIWPSCVGIDEESKL